MNIFNGRHNGGVGPLIAAVHIVCDRDALRGEALGEQLPGHMGVQFTPLGGEDGGSGGVQYPNVWDLLLHHYVRQGEAVRGEYPGVPVHVYPLHAQGLRDRAAVLGAWGHT